MAMPRPGGRALKISEQVIPGLARHRSAKKVASSGRNKGSLSRVEAMQTNNIKNEGRFK